MGFSPSVYTLGGGKQIHPPIFPGGHRQAVPSSIPAPSQYQSGEIDSPQIAHVEPANVCSIFPISPSVQVEVENPDSERFPEFAKAPYLECVLQPGEVLFIPVRHWHYVRSLELSFSVSFWWSWLHIRDEINIYFSIKYAFGLFTPAVKGNQSGVFK